MPKINSRAKGARGEREFCEWLRNTLDLDFTPQRNLEQVRSGGSDILDVYPFVFEVKRVEKLQLKKWWLQVKAACRHDENLIPIVAYRQNGKKWSFLIPAVYICIEHGFIQLDENVGKKWLQMAHQRLND